MNKEEFSMLKSLIVRLLVWGPVFKIFMSSFWAHYLKKGNLAAVERLVRLVILKHMPGDNHFQSKSKEEMLSLLKEVGSNMKQCPVNGSLEIVDGAMVPSAATIPLEDGTSLIAICSELLVKEVMILLETNHLRKELGCDLIYSVILHEIWHSIQFRFLFEKGGLGLLKQILGAESRYYYGDSPLERGAYAYGNSYGRVRQNLNELLAS
jgi:hypothetical protein